MGRAARLRGFLQAAVCDALAVTCTMPLVGCGGATESIVVPDSGARNASNAPAPTAPTLSDVDSSTQPNAPAPSNMVPVVDGSGGGPPPSPTVVDASTPNPPTDVADASTQMPVTVPAGEAGWGWLDADTSSPMWGEGGHALAASDVSQPSVVDATTGDAFASRDSSSPSDAGCTQAFSLACGTVTLPCIPLGVAFGYNNAPACVAECGLSSIGCDLAAIEGGRGYAFTCLCGGGRFPAGLETKAPGKGASASGSYLALAAALESASVRSFAQLARELTAHGAPASLIARARAAARQETTHARLLRQAAAARGCTVPRLRSRKAPREARSLEELARENAVEGCGRETLGAALLKFQGLRARDPALRPIFSRIAEDEAEHAELAWDLQEWLESRLDAAARGRVRKEREAFLAMCESEGPPRDARIAGPLGLPSPLQWRALVATVRAGVEEIAA